MKRILLTTDFSEVSEKAVLYALNLLGNEACEFTFLNASQLFQDNSPSDASFNYSEGFYSVSMVSMQKFIANAQQLDTLGIHTFKGLFFPVKPIEAVNFLTYQQDYDMIVTGTKRKNKGVSSSNIASSILKTTTTNAVVIPEQIDIAPLKNIVMVFDGQNGCSFEDLTILKAILPKNNATLTVLQIQKTKLSIALHLLSKIIITSSKE
jgi:nucleotide-binding universal stress UspA family protein